MKFSRSLFGYSPSEVEKTINEVLVKYELEKRALFSSLDNANKEYDKLVEQRTMLTANLQSSRDNSLYLHKYKEHSDNTLTHAERDAIAIVEEITEERERFINKINKTIEEIDSLIIVLRQEFLAMTGPLDKVIESIVTNSEENNQIAASLDSTIESLSNIESTIEPFKALDFNTQIVANDTLDSSVLAQPTTKPAPFSPFVVPAKNNKVTNISTRTKRPKTALIAENDPEIHTLLSYILKREGFDIILATDAYMLKDMLKEKEQPGIIILDTLLPYIQSNVLIKDIKASGTWCDVPILLMTSEHNKQATIEALESGANDSIEKPFNPREVVARVKRLNQSNDNSSCKVGG